MLDNPEITLYHTGVVTDDIAKAMDLWGNAYGLHWAPPRTTTSLVQSPAGVLSRNVLLTYSIEGPHHIELLEQVDATPYESLTGGRHAHHLGYYTKDLGGQADRLEKLGFVREMAGISETGELERFTYHQNPLSPGFWIELVAEDLAIDIDKWLSDAADDQGIPYRSFIN